MRITRVYIDGFNLYYGIIARNRLHWLDLNEFSKRLNRGVDVERIIYCTARVSSTPDDPLKSQRQDIYLRALRAACANVEIVEGNFSSHKKPQPLADCPHAAFCQVRVVIRTEKGSDVNLASRLLHDAHLNKYDRAIVVSGDSDLVEPIRLVTQEVGKEVWVRNPRAVNSSELRAVASDYQTIATAVAKSAQFSDTVAGLCKPERWKSPWRVAKKCEVLNVACPQPACTKRIKTCCYT